MTKFHIDPASDEVFLLNLMAVNIMGKGGNASFTSYRRNSPIL